jgi:hypothetical protein
MAEFELGTGRKNFGLGTGTEIMSFEAMTRFDERCGKRSSGARWKRPPRWLVLPVLSLLLIGD